MALDWAGNARRRCPLFSTRAEKLCRLFADELKVVAMTADGSGFMGDTNFMIEDMRPPNSDELCPPDVLASWFCYAMLLAAWALWVVGTGDLPPA